jgi:hypothetical protein
MMAMSSDRRCGSAIDYYMQRPCYKFHNFQTSVRVLSDVYRVLPEHTENTHQLMEWRMRKYHTTLISRLDGLGPRLPYLEAFSVVISPACSTMLIGYLFAARSASFI